MSIIHRGTTITGTAIATQSSPSVTGLHFGWNVVYFPNAPGSFSGPITLDWGTTSGSTGAGGWNIAVTGLSGGRGFTVIIPSSAAQAPANYYRFYWVFNTGVPTADVWYPTSTTWFQIEDSKRNRLQSIMF